MDYIEREEGGEVRELPILFSTEMVQAILDGRKTMTRQVIKDKDITNRFDIDVDGTAIAYIEQSTGDSYKPEYTCPYQPGDRLYVREAIKKIEWPDGIDGIAYVADNEPVWDITRPCRWVWKNKRLPSMYMPKAAARIWLEVVSVRVERLQEITEEDAVKEGIKNVFERNPHYDGTIGSAIKINHLTQFRELWDSFNAKRGYGWDVNPWAWVIEFKKVTPCN